MIETKNGYNMYDISSMVQKSIRRGLIEDAMFAAYELESFNKTYVWNRLLTVSAEDCNDGLTNIIAKMREEYFKTSDKCYLCTAVNTLVKARKNRDADYFVCNYQNSREPIKIVSEPSPYLTRNGHSMKAVKNELERAILDKDFKMVGYCTIELLRYRNVFWRLILKLSDKYGNKSLSEEINCLKELDIEQSKKKNDNELFISKALIILMKYGTDENLVQFFISYDLVGLYQVKKTVRLIPEYVYDCHTHRGKLNGKTTQMFVVDEQRALNPKVQGFFDNAKWDRFFVLLKIGFENKVNITPEPSPKEIKKAEESETQMTLF